MNKYLVATATGGLMEMPDVTYELYDIIEAEDREEACKAYNKKHDCDFFYGTVMAENIGDTTTVINDIVPWREVKRLTN